MNLEEIKQFVDNLQHAKVCNGLTIIAQRDKNNNASIQMILVDNLVTVKTAVVVFKIDDPAITADKIRNRLGEEFAACWHAVFTKAVSPDSYVDDGSPVMLVEEISGDKVVRI